MNAPPRILVTNDDGYTAPGIQALAEALDGLGEVWVVAPDREQSAVSHAITLNRPLHIEPMGERRFAVDGTPTDCVTLAIGSIMEANPPDLVVSGINCGGNMGVDVHYSGTVSAAFEGVILGFRALAVSQTKTNGITTSYDQAGLIACEVAAWILKCGLPADTLLNINVPAGAPRTVRLTRLGVRRYTEGVIEQIDPRGRRIYWIGGGEPIWEPIPGTDFYEVGQGHISVSPLHLDMTDRRFLAELSKSPPAWVRENDHE